MNRIFMLDSGPLGAVAHPRPNLALTQKLISLIANNDVVVVPEICDYEVRRSFLLEGLVESVERLNRLKERFAYLPLTTDVMLKAAEFWAEVRKRGQKTADDKSLDADVILAAQASSLNAIVLTDNVKHLEQFVVAKKIQDI